MGKNNKSMVGEILQEEYLVPLGISVAQLSQHTGISVEVLNRLLNDNIGMNEDIAMCLSKYFGTSVEFWMNI